MKNMIIKILFIVVIILIVLTFIFFYYTNFRTKELQTEFNYCLNIETRDLIPSHIVKEMEAITKYIEENNYQVSVKYENLITGFNYSYNASQIYYGCSLIKLVDALYLINKAMNKEIDLDKTTITYTSNYIKDSSLGLEKHEIGDKISLRDLISYAISLSDNSAHLMLLDYIGYDNLKEYGLSLGATELLNTGDDFGNQTVIDTNIYLKEAYRIITTNEEYGSFLKEIMGNDYRNSYNTDSIKIYHKYGSWDVNYHDIGLNLDIEHPYAISILTLHEGRNYQEVVQNIHSKILELHNDFYEYRNESCEYLKNN